MKRLLRLDRIHDVRAQAMDVVRPEPASGVREEAPEVMSGHVLARVRLTGAWGAARIQLAGVRGAGG